MLTGPLPELIEHRKLANQAGVLEGSIPIERFLRFKGMLAEATGDVQLDLSFDRGDLKCTLVAGKVSTKVHLVCQSCMTLYVQTMNCDISASVVVDESKQVVYEQETEVIVHAEKLIPIVDLVEDELILALRMIPRHPDECPDGEYSQEPVVEAVIPEVSETETYRPFANLAETINKQNKAES